MAEKLPNIAKKKPKIAEESQIQLKIAEQQPDIAEKAETAEKLQTLLKRSQIKLKKAGIDIVLTGDIVQQQSLLHYEFNVFSISQLHLCTTCPASHFNKQVPQLTRSWWYKWLALMLARNVFMFQTLLMTRRRSTAFFRQIST